MDQNNKSQQSDPKLLFQRAISLHQSGQILDAMAIYRQLIKLFPRDAFLLFLLGTAEGQKGNALESMKLFDQSLEISPNDPNTYYNRGKALKELNRLDEALRSFDVAIQLKPDHIEAHNNRGVVLSELKQTDDALQSYDRAIQLKPDYAEAYSNRGGLLLDLKRFDEALLSYNRAISIRPDWTETYILKAELLLLMGDYLQGWSLYELRWKTAFRAGIKPLPIKCALWLGERSLVDKTILIHPEVGYGDFIMFVRYVHQLQRLGAKVVIYAPSALVSLFDASMDDVSVVEMGRPIPHIDFHCPIMSLPHAFRTTLESIPSEIPYLRVPAAKLEYWSKKIGKPQRLRIGLMWSGQPNRNIDNNPLRTRSIPLAFLDPLLDLPIDFHALQKDILHPDLLGLSRISNITIYDNELSDFSDTAALIQEMDLVISIDTSVAHLAGALGKPLWVLLPYASDYRWGFKGSQTPWYPAATLFRQTSIEDWGSVINEVREKLRIMVA